MTALSPLRLRMVLAVFGLCGGLLAAAMSAWVAVTRSGARAPAITIGVIAAMIAASAVIDLGVLARRSAGAVDDVSRAGRRPAITGAAVEVADRWRAPLKRR